MATTGTSRRRTGETWRERRENRRALYRFAEFWAALQAVGDVLAEADRLTAAAADKGSRGSIQRHWTIATPEEIRSGLKRCRGSLRILSASAKRFEPELIVRDWRR
jgi:hypothetical protein